MTPYDEQKFPAKLFLNFFVESTLHVAVALQNCKNDELVILSNLPSRSWLDVSLTT